MTVFLDFAGFYLFFNGSVFKGIPIMLFDNSSQRRRPSLLLWNPNSDQNLENYRCLDSFSSIFYKKWSKMREKYRSLVE
jgi:hypothetical protein